MWYHTMTRRTDEEKAKLDLAFFSGFHMEDDYAVVAGGMRYFEAEYNVLTALGIRSTSGFVTCTEDNRLVGVDFRTDEIRFTDINTGLLIGVASIKTTNGHAVPNEQVSDLVNDANARINELSDEEYQNRVDYRRDMQAAGL